MKLSKHSLSLFFLVIDLCKLKLNLLALSLHVLRLVEKSFETS